MSTEAAMLPALARAAIADALGITSVGFDASAGWLRQPGASFVTLTRRGALRGCIGSLQAWRALMDDLKANAVAAALHDPRFAPLSAVEFGQVRIEVSLLSPAQPLAFEDEADALAQLRPGIDGVILEHRGQRATFLPQVWEQLPDRREFISHLKRKAGLPAGFWHEAIRLQRYTVVKYRESGDE